MRKINWKISKSSKALVTNKFIDLCIVILGVTIAFQLNNIKQRADQKSLENFYKQSLRIDVDKDIDQMNSILNKLKSDHRLISRALATGDASPDTLQLAIFEALSFETFNTRHDNTFQNILNSGYSSISNELRSATQDYYKCYSNFDRFEMVYTEFITNQFHPYFAPRFEYAKAKLLDPHVAQDVQARNNLFIVSALLNDGIENYQHAIERAMALNNLLGAK